MLIAKDIIILSTLQKITSMGEMYKFDCQMAENPSYLLTAPIVLLYIV